MRNTSDFVGLLAYLALMYGRLPDRDMVQAAYSATFHEHEDAPPRHLTLVVSNDTIPAPQEQPDDASKHPSAAA
jgi:hypothetical protein